MRSTILVLAASVLGSCGAGNSAQPKVRELSPMEQAAMDSAGIGAGITAILRTHIPETFYLHTPEAGINNGSSGAPVERHPWRGVAFKVHSDSSAVRMAAIAQRVGVEGYAVYRSNMGFGIEPDEVCVLMTQQDDRSILRYEQTEGVNYGITTDSLIRTLDAWKLQLRITGASSDWMEASIEAPVQDWDALARQVYAFCPDVVDQGTGTVEALAEEMRLSRTLFLWWD